MNMWTWILTSLVTLSTIIKDECLAMYTCQSYSSCNISQRCCNYLPQSKPIMWVVISDTWSVLDVFAALENDVCTIIHLPMNINFIQWSYWSYTTWVLPVFGTQHNPHTMFPCNLTNTNATILMKLSANMPVTIHWHWLAILVMTSQQLFVDEWCVNECKKGHCVVCKTHQRRMKIPYPVSKEIQSKFYYCDHNIMIVCTMLQSVARHSESKD